jgi:hypothetical protein
MVWHDNFGAVFFMGIGGLIITLLHLSIKYCYRMKISSCSCCCIKIERDVESEMKIDVIEGDTTDETHVRAQKRKSSALNLPVV